MATGEGLHLTLIDVCAELLLQIRRRNMLSCGSRSRNFDLGVMVLTWATLENQESTTPLQSIRVNMEPRTVMVQRAHVGRGLPSTQENVAVAQAYTYGGRERDRERQRETGLSESLCCELGCE